VDLTKLNKCREVFRERKIAEKVDLVDGTRSRAWVAADESP
jgi:hypothetical protein